MPLYDNADKRPRRRQDSACTTSNPCSASVHRIACLDTLLLTLLILALLIAFGSATGFHGWLRKTDVTKFKDGLRVLVTKHDGAVLNHIQQQQQEEEVLRGSVLPGRKLLADNEQVQGSGSSRLRGSKAPAVTIPASNSSQTADEKDNTPNIKFTEGGSQLAGKPKHVVLKWSGPEYDQKTNSTYVVLVNVGSETVQWEVVDDPRWLDVVPAQGKLQPKTLKRLSLDLVAKVLPTVSGTVRIRGELPADKHFGELAIPVTASVFSSSRSQGFIDRSTESHAQHTAEPIQQPSVTITADAAESSSNKITPVAALEGAQPAVTAAAEQESGADGPAGNENQTLLALNATAQLASMLVASSIAVPQEEFRLNATASRSIDTQAEAETTKIDDRQTEIVTAADDAVLPAVTEPGGASDPLQALKEADVDDFRQALGGKSGQGIAGVVQPAEGEGGGSQPEEARDAEDRIAPTAPAPAVLDQATKQHSASLVDANAAAVDADTAADVVQVSATSSNAVIASVPAPALDAETVALASVAMQALGEGSKLATDVAPAKEVVDALHDALDSHRVEHVEIVSTSEDPLSHEREVAQSVDVQDDVDNDIELFAAIPDNVLDDKTDEFNEVPRDVNADLVDELDAHDTDRLQAEEYVANAQMADAQKRAEPIDDQFVADEGEPEVRSGTERVAARSENVDVVSEEQPQLERLSPQQQKDMQRELHSYMWAVGGVSSLVYIVAGICGTIFLFLIFRRWSRSSIARRLTYHEKLTPPPSSHRGNQPGRRFSDRGTPTGWNASWKDDSWDNTDN